MMKILLSVNRDAFCSGFCHTSSFLASQLHAQATSKVKSYYEDPYFPRRWVPCFPPCQIIMENANCLKSFTNLAFFLDAIVNVAAKTISYLEISKHYIRVSFPASCHYILQMQLKIPTRAIAWTSTNYFFTLILECHQ